MTISYAASGLAIGDHEGTIRIASPQASNSPRMVSILLHVVPASCFRDSFSYYDGDLTVMGGASWSGSATSQIVVQNDALEVVGGGGAASAADAVLCGGPDGLIGVRLKIQKGAGTGDFFWNLAIDDDSGSSSTGNFARWYGGSTIARGRVGTTITGDLILSGGGAWDDLYVRIDAAANTSEFFFNGESHGTISHGTGPGSEVGAIRIERLDRAGAGGDRIRFDDLVIERIRRRPTFCVLRGGRGSAA